MMATVRLTLVLIVILVVIWRCGLPALPALPAILLAAAALIRSLSSTDKA